MADELNVPDPAKVSDPNLPKTVLESEFLAYKTSAEQKLADLTAGHTKSLGDLTTQYETTRQSVIQLEAEKERLAEQVKLHIEQGGKLTQTEADLNVTKTNLATRETEVAGLQKKIISLEYGVSMETMEGKDLAALKSYEEALKAVGGNGTNRIGNYAIGAGNQGSPITPQKPRDRAAAVLAEADAKHGIKRSDDGHLA